MQGPSASWLSNPTEEFAALNFQDGSYLDAQNQSRPCFHLTRNGVVRYLAKFGGIESGRDLRRRPFNGFSVYFAPCNPLYSRESGTSQGSFALKALPIF